MVESKTLHYLHPDFEGSYEKPESPASSLLYWNSYKATNIFSSSAFADKSKSCNNPTSISMTTCKRPSPLALLAETCNSIGGTNDAVSKSSTVSPISNTSTQKLSKRHGNEVNSSKSAKRVKSQYQNHNNPYQISSPSSSLSSITSSSSSSASKLVTKPSSNNQVESTRADTSTNHQFSTNSNSNNQYDDPNEMKKLNAVASSILFCLQQQLIDMKFNGNTNKNNENGLNDSHSGLNLNHILQKMIQQYNTSNNNSNNSDNNDPPALSPQTNSSLSTKTPHPEHNGNDKLHVPTDDNNTNHNNDTGIKFCLYCGKYVPYLPMLVAHIHQHISPPNHLSSTSPPSSSPTVSLIDFLLKLSPSNQNPSFLPLNNHKTLPVHPLDDPMTSLFVNTNHNTTLSTTNSFPNSDISTSKFSHLSSSLTSSSSYTNNNQNNLSDNSSTASVTTTPQSPNTIISQTTSSNFHNIHRLIY